MSFQLYDYQRTAADFVKQHNRVGLFLDMGLRQDTCCLDRIR